ncbi:NAD(P)H-dependent oxidoreductase [Enterococcus gallinarum]|uniref:NAD(P)H-dependent oxidoreductase n=1 Tax=Enterococcus gallinarum TaxID=1353 RepID=UPI0032E52B4D
MIRTLVIASHPSYDDSLSQRFFSESAKMPNVSVHMLDKVAGNFDLEIELERLQTIDRLIFQFPLYWYQVPAKMKCWIDTVWEAAKPYLLNKEIGFALSTGVAAKEFQLGGKEGASFSEILRPLTLMAQKYQMTILPVLVLDQLMYKTEKEKRRFVIDYQQLLTMEAPFSFAAKQQWFIQRLEALTAENPKLAPLLDQLIQNQETLLELDEALAEMEAYE